MAVNLKDLVAQRIENDVFRPICEQPHNKDISYWPVLIVDNQSLPVLISCCELYSKMFDGISWVDELEKDRNAHRSVEAIYLITPCEKSLKLLINDFLSPGRCKYKAAHVFFTYECPPKLLKELDGHPLNGFIKTLTNINLGFVAYEPQVFTLNHHEENSVCCKPKKPDLCDPAVMERIASQIYTVCVTIGECSNIRYRKECGANVKLAEFLQLKLSAIKTTDPSFGKAGDHTAKFEILILDREFDCISPLLHELTLQAMAFDLVPLRNHFDRYEPNQLFNGKLKKDVFLEERRVRWAKLRHQHIADAIKSIAAYQEMFPKQEELKDVKDRSLIDVWHMIKQVPQYRMEISRHYSLFRVINSCVSSYSKKVEKLYEIEQKLIMNTESAGENFTTLMKDVQSILNDCDINNYDKIRIILLLAIVKCVSEEQLAELSLSAGIHVEEYKRIFPSLELNLGAGTKRSMIKDNILETTGAIQSCETPRWTPLLKKIAEDALKGKLDQDRYPIFRTHTAQEQRYDEQTSPNRVQGLQKLVIFIVGGLTYSEMRIIHEVSAAFHCDILVGSTHFLTPEDYLNDLKNISLV